MPRNLNNLAQRAAARKVERPAIKTQEAVQEENENFKILKDLVYEEIMEQR